MNADGGPATRTDPLGPLVCREILEAEDVYGLEILDHAHPIFRPVAFVQVGQHFTGKTRAIGTITRLAAHPAVAVLEAASDASLGLAAVITPATGAGIPRFQVCLAQAAVHPTRGNQRSRSQAFCRRRALLVLLLCPHAKTEIKAMRLRTRRWAGVHASACSSPRTASARSR